jgi:hypothetical protein
LPLAHTHLFASDLGKGSANSGRSGTLWQDMSKGVLSTIAGKEDQTQILLRAAKHAEDLLKKRVEILRSQIWKV